MANPKMAAPANVARGWSLTDFLTGRRERASHISLVLGRFSRSLERAACELGHASRRFSPVRWRYLSRLRPCRRSFSDKVFSRVESLAIVVILVGSEAT
jgi:hypothetical protein